MTVSQFFYLSMIVLWGLAILMGVIGVIAEVGFNTHKKWITNMYVTGLLFTILAVLSSILAKSIE